MAVAVALNAINVAGTTAIIINNKSKRKTNIKRQKGEVGKHFCLCRRFSAMFSFPIV
jgi:hypothetical protein